MAAPEHTTEENFQHFLSYSNLRMNLPEHIEALRWTYFAGADKPRPNQWPIDGNGSPV